MGQFNVQRTYDWALIKAMAVHPRTWEHIGDDFSPKPSEWEPDRNENIHYVIAKDAEVLAMLVLWPESRICWRAHVCVMPHAYGDKGIAAVKAIIQWAWDNTTCLRLIASIPEFNTLAIAFAVKCGLIGFGMNPKSYMKNGSLHNLIMLGISKQ